MHIRTRHWCRAFDQEKRSIATVRESGHLGKEAAVNQRRPEITDSLALDEHLIVNQVIAGREMDHADLERAASTHGIKQFRAALRVVDSDLMNRFWQHASGV